LTPEQEAIAYVVITWSGAFLAMIILFIAAHVAFDLLRYGLRRPRARQALGEK
jgi:hypothetical protein